MRTLRFSFVLLCAVIGATFIIITSGATAPGEAVNRNNCQRLFTKSEFYTYADQVYRRKTISRKAKRYVEQRITCQQTAEAQAWANRKQHHFKHLRWVRLHPWQHKRRNLSATIRARLSNLRGCETRGIPYPQNYRYDGHHDGAYQYDHATWQEAQDYFAARKGSIPSRTTYAYQAIPAHQDVVTAAFFPGHTSRWACSA